MSEFSESFHLEADAQDAGVQLLRLARLKGFVFPPKNGWVTILPESDFGKPPRKLFKANQGQMLRYLFDEDSGWMFEVYQGPKRICAYTCRWLDWSNAENRIVIDDSGLHLEVVRELAEQHGPHSDEALDRILYPRIVRRGSAEGFDDFEDWARTDLDASPAFAFAETLGLPEYRWFGWRYRRKWDQEGVAEV